LASGLLTIGLTVMFGRDFRLWKRRRPDAQRICRSTEKIDLTGSVCNTKAVSTSGCDTKMSLGHAATPKIKAPPRAAAGLRALEISRRRKSLLRKRKCHSDLTPILLHQIFGTVRNASLGLTVELIHHFLKLYQTWIVKLCNRFHFAPNKIEV